MAPAGALLLAAGRSRRFGSDKRQALGEWTGPLLHHVIGLYRPLFADLAVVIARHDRFGDEACARFGATRLINDEADLGMGRSLAVGIAWAIRQALPCVVVGLADMPWIPTAMIAEIAGAGLQSGRLVAPRFLGEIGFPRAIPADHFADLLDLSEDRGASARLDWRQALLLDSADPGICRDVDRPGDTLSR
jgi:molybdenum cofactor cytidylyltransferase